MTLLPQGRAQAGEIARRLGVGQRTFARRLSAEGVTFSEVLESTRSHLARRYLADASLSISQIAWMSGYQEVSAFTHAFKRWTGRVPRDVRSELPLPTRVLDHMAGDGLPLLARKRSGETFAFPPLVGGRPDILQRGQNRHD